MKKYTFSVFSGGQQGGEKYDQNIIHKRLINNFMSCILDLLKNIPNKDIFEIGCGEGQIMGVLYQNGYNVSGIDFSEEAVDISLNNFKKHFGVEVDVKTGDVYDVKNLKRNRTVICCEVLEHLEEPQRALQNISEVAEEYFLLSVPHEPIWCVLNFVRGKYIKHWGNTPGHINHWNKGHFIKLCKLYGDVVAVRTPLPWIMVLVRKNKERTNEMMER